MRHLNASRFAGFIAALLFASATMGASSCNKQPVPPQSVQAIARDMIVNGVPTSVVGMQFAGTPSEVASTFREYWKADDVPTKSQNDPSGTLLSALDDQCLYVLTISPQPDTARTRGLMSIIKLGTEPAAHRIPDSAVPLPEESKVMSDIESRDPGQTGRTWILDVPGEARWNAQRYRNMLAARGWASVGREPNYLSAGARSTHGTAFTMQRSDDSVDVSFSDRGGRTVAVVNATRSR